MDEKALSPGYYFGRYHYPDDVIAEKDGKPDLAISIETSSGSEISGIICLLPRAYLQTASIYSFQGTVDGKEFCSTYKSWGCVWSARGSIKTSLSDSCDYPKTYISGEVRVALFPWIKSIWYKTGLSFFYRKVIIAYCSWYWNLCSKICSKFGVKLPRGSAAITSGLKGSFYALFGKFLLGEEKFIKAGSFEVEGVSKQTPIELEKAKYKLRNVKTGEQDGPHSLRNFVNLFADKVWTEEEGWEVSACGAKWVPVDAILKQLMEKFDCEKFWLPRKERKMARECLIFGIEETLRITWPLL